MSESITAVPLETEVWFRIEIASRGANDDWCLLDNRTYDSIAAADSYMKRHAKAMDRDSAFYHYRLVRVTTITEQVLYE